jgi:hypothetical protein
MATQDLLEYLCDQVPGTTEEVERAWFDQVIEDWIRAQQPADYPESAARLCHTAEFIHRLADLIPPHVRIWLHGWSAAYTHVAFARAVGLEPDD